VRLRFSGRVNGSKLRGKADRAGLVGGELNDEGFVGEGREVLARVRDAVASEGRARNRDGKVEVATIVLRVTLRELQVQVAQRLVALLLAAQPVFPEPVGHFLVLAVAPALEGVVEG